MIASTGISSSSSRYVHSTTSVHVCALLPQLISWISYFHKSSHFNISSIKALGQPPYKQSITLILMHLFCREQILKHENYSTFTRATHVIIQPSNLYACYISSYVDYDYISFIYCSLPCENYAIIMYWKNIIVKVVKN